MDLNYSAEEQAFRGERVAIRPRATDGHYGIFFGATRIATIDLTT